MDIQTESTHRTQRRRPTIAKEWQLAVLKKLQSNSRNPTEEQRSAAAAETGLDEKWVRDWFTRQRSKVSARNRKRQLAATEPRQPRAHSATVPTFKLQLYHPPVVPSGPQDLLSHRSVSTPIDPAPYLATNSPRQPSPASLESRSPRSSRSAVNAQAIPRSHRSISVPLYLNNPSQDPVPILHTTAISTYSRDPLCDRYPDFSQFFRPQVYERFRSSELSTLINDHNLIQLLAIPNMDSHAPMHFHGSFDLFNSHHLGGLPTHQSSSTYLRPCPVAFSMRLVDLLGYPGLAQYPFFLPSELGDHI